MRHCCIAEDPRPVSSVAKEFLKKRNKTCTFCLSSQAKNSWVQVARRWRLACNNATGVCRGELCRPKLDLTGE